MLVVLGDRVKDKVTGLSGIAVARTEWLYGCIRITVQPEKLGKDGNVPETSTFDEPQLEVVKSQVVKNTKINTVANYGPRDDKAALRK